MTTILLVDDDLSIREAVGQILVDAGYTVCLAASGREALSVLDGQQKPNLIILDLAMPEMSGWDFLAHKRALPGVGDVPVLLFAASLRKGADSPEPTVDGYLAKPVDLEVLLATVELYCQPAAGGAHHA